MDRNNRWHYSTVAKFFHWTIAILIITLLSLGWFMTSTLPQPNSGWYIQLHKSLGLIAATLILGRLTWRLTHPPAPLPGIVPHWQVIIARLSHWLLYICMIVMPLSGFLGSSFGKYGVAFFGLPLPIWANQNTAISAQLFQIHDMTASILAMLITIHVLAAFKHLLISKDGVFQRMWFRY